jgi:mono/diheme cytochrome c family protein
MMRVWWLGVVGVALLATGAVGMLVVAAQVDSSSATSRGRAVAPTNAPVDGFASNGERIYYSGVGHVGPIPRVQAGGPGFGGMMGRAGMMGGVGCVGCHGADGRGLVIGMMGPAIEVPDIRYVALVSPHQETSGTTPGWTDTQIADSIRRGVEPSGKRLDPPMPRWDMDDTDMRDLIGYLKELSRP